MKLENKDYPDTIYVRPDATTALDQDMSQALVARTAPFIDSRKYVLDRQIAQAIALEREACAKVLDALAEVISDEIAEADSNMSRQILSTQRHAVQTGAAAIRQRGERNG